MADDPTQNPTSAPKLEEKLEEKLQEPTVTNYLSELVKSGKLKREGTRGGTKYSA